MKDLLVTLRVLDDDGRLSLTNLVIVGVMVAITVHGASVDSAIALVAALANYAHKRYVRSQEQPEPQPKLEDAHAVIASVESVRHELADLRDSLNTVKLAAGFVPKGK